MRVPGWRGPWVGLLGVPGKGCAGPFFPSPGLSTRVSVRPAGRPYRGKPSDMWALGVVLGPVHHAVWPDSLLRQHPTGALRQDQGEYTIPLPGRWPVRLEGQKQHGRLGVLGQDPAPARRLSARCPLSCIRDEDGFLRTPCVSSGNCFRPTTLSSAWPWPASWRP